MQFKREICVDSPESAINAQEAGAHRIELCNNLIEGGTTPSYGMILSVRKNLDIPVNVLIRPRGGDFLYSEREYDIMRRDIELCGEAEANGVVIGILLREGYVDVERSARLIEFAGPLEVTFHRAFDMSPDPHKALEDVISSGATRLLSSGLRQTAAEGIDILADLVGRAGERLIIMPGRGINTSNIDLIAIRSGASEFHLSARKFTDSDMTFRNPDVSLGGYADIPEYGRKIADIDIISNIADKLKMI
jgi:copper homeostasis protein